MPGRLLRKVINTRPINNVGKQIGDGLWCMLAKATALRVLSTDEAFEHYHNDLQKLRVYIERGYLHQFPQHEHPIGCPPTSPAHRGGDDHGTPDPLPFPAVLVHGTCHLVKTRDSRGSAPDEGARHGLSTQPRSAAPLYLAPKSALVIFPPGTVIADAARAMLESLEDDPVNTAAE